MIYTSDRDIPETIWNNYVRVFDSKYKIFKDSTTGIHYLKCKYGSVQVHSMLKHELSAVLQFKSNQGVEVAKQRLTELSPQSYTSQEGEGDVVIVFPEADLDKVAGYLQVRYKRTYTPEQKQKLMERFHKQVTNVGNLTDGQEG